jgi:5'(3')-deoxyribonucleotidase
MFTPRRGIPRNSFSFLKYLKARSVTSNVKLSNYFSYSDCFMNQVEEIQRQKTYYNFKVMACTRPITEEYTRKYDLSIFVSSHSQLYENKRGEFVIATITKSRVQVGSMTLQHY